MVHMYLYVYASMHTHKYDIYIYTYLHVWMQTPTSPHHCKRPPWKGSREFCGLRRPPDKLLRRAGGRKPATCRHLGAEWRSWCNMVRIIHRHTALQINMYVCNCVYVYLCIYVCVYVYIYIHICLSVCLSVYLYVHTHIDRGSCAYSVIAG